MSRLAHLLLALLVAVAPVTGVCHCEPGAMLRILLACHEPASDHICTHHGHDGEEDVPDSPHPKCPVALHCAAGLDLLFEPAQDVSTPVADGLTVVAPAFLAVEAVRHIGRPPAQAFAHPPPLRGHLRFCRLHI